MSAPRVIRVVYLYIFSVVGLVLAVIGAVGMLDLALKAAVFTAAERDQAWHERMPPTPPDPPRARAAAEDSTLEAGDRATLRAWAEDYRRWEETGRRIDPVRSRRERAAAQNLALLLVGIPLYLYHWRTVRREAQA